MTTKALMFHPEFPTMWGYRREILLSGAIEGERKHLLQAEMKLLEKALRKSQKVYSIWFHRKWVVEKLFQACASEKEANAVLDVELDLCMRLLEVDERNFHCWNHRAYVMGMMLSQQQRVMPSSAQQDLSKGDFRTLPSEYMDKLYAKFNEAANSSENGKRRQEGKKSGHVDLSAIDLKLSKDLINRNFSNYSAWHLRALLQQPAPLASCDDVQPAAKDLGIDIGEELEWVQQGIYTEPNDQSLWLYHHWLTVLGRGHERLTITHCAVLGAELFVFFSGPTSIRSASNSDEILGSVSISDSNVLGTFVAITPSDSVRSRTRCLPIARRRWANVWQFKPHSSSETEVASLLNVEKVGDIKLEVAVEVIGNHATGAAAYGYRTLSFCGPPVLCDCTTAASGETARLALLGHEAEPTRAALLQTELERVEELLDIEPDCKWALLSKSRLATLCAAGNPERAREIELACSEAYVTIAELDPLRKGFYEAARAECLLRLRLLTWTTADLGSCLDVTGLSLRHLAPTPIISAFGVRVLNVSKNDLRQLGSLLLLRSLEELDASSNQIVGDVTEAFVLSRLRRLNVSRNKMDLKGSSNVPPPANLIELDMSYNAAVLSLVAQTASGGMASFSPADRNSLPEDIRKHLFPGVAPDACKGWELVLDSEPETSFGKCVCRCREQ